ncbi:unnamed protein product [Kluyveromyces dobzhanskii CBS 2104]|uniref:Dynein heavy chain, cytoplasmic n=1 Tax=Kluyveromyces dobzhanskii CBS 2104 TaxID=1427455 RepID=A0A0A8LD08_9SACH|nr:unnamed protein product [Kluyveromyces dobzhanskii CBS 2104]
MQPIEDVLESALSFIHGISSLYFKNTETASSFKDKHINQVDQWLGENTDINPMFLVQDSKTSQVEMIVNKIPENFAQNNILMIMKNLSIMDPEMSIESQLNIMMLPHGSQFDALKSLVDVGLYQLFDKIVTNRERSSKNAADSVISTKKKIKELSLSLQNLDKEIQLPNIEDSIHPLVKQFTADGAKPGNVEEVIPVDVLNDTTFLNALQKTSNSWVKAVHSISRLENNLEDGTAMDEVNFWKNYYTALRELERKLASAEVELTIGILVYAKRFYSSTSFINDTGLPHMIEKAQNYSFFLDGLALSNISSATSIIDLNQAIDTFAFEFKRLRITQYPLDQAVKMVEKVSAEITAKLKEILPNLLLMNYHEFLTTKDETVTLLNNFDDKLKDFTLIIRELMRKKAVRFLFLKFTCSTEGLKQRMLDIFTFRYQHHAFKQALKTVKSPALIAIIESIYDELKTINVLKTDEATWSQLEKNYLAGIASIEDQIIIMLNTELEVCQTSKDMFSIFEKYEFLTKRDRVFNAIREYQRQLLRNVKNDIYSIKDSISSSISTKAVNEHFDIQPVIQEIVRRKKISKKLELLTSKLTIILGPEWDKTISGSEISKECVSVQTSLNTDKVVDACLSSAKAANFSLDECIFKIILTSSAYELKVNFDFSAGSLFKTVRNLIWQGYDIPSSIVRLSRITRNVYPHAAIIAEKLQTFFLVIGGINRLSYTVPLLRNALDEVWGTLMVLVTDSWETVPLETTFDETNMTGNIGKFERGVDRLLHEYEKVSTKETEFHDFYASLESTSIADISGEVTRPLQNLVDLLQLESSTESQLFINILNSKLRVILTEKFKVFTKLLNEEPTEQSIIFSNGSFELLPSFFAVKSTWVNKLTHLTNILQNQPKLSFSSLNPISQFETFADILLDLQPFISNYMESVARFYTSTGEILSQWKELEYLWVLSEENFVSSVCADIQSCLEFIDNAYEQRKKMSYASAVKDIESLIKVNQEQAVLQCCSKVDQWLALGVKHLTQLYVQMSVSMHHQLTLDRKFFEDTSVNFSSLKNTTEIIIHLDVVSSKMEEMLEQFSVLKSSQRLLIQARVHFPDDFIYCEQLKADFDSLKEICSKRESAVSENRDNIASKLENEMRRLKLVSESLTKSWKNQKPTGSDTEPSVALDVINSFEESINSTKNHMHDLLTTAKVLLIPTTLCFDLDSLSTEVKNYKDMWTSVGVLWNSMQVIVNATWNSVIINESKQSLETLLENSDGLPPGVLQYSVFQNLLQSIRSVLGAVKVLENLKNAPLKPKHWSAMFQKLGSYEPSHEILESETFSLMDVLSMNIAFNEMEVYSIINQAKDEEVLASALKDIKIKWKKVTVDSFLHPSGVKLIKNWSALFSITTDDINTLVSMRNSQFYNMFEQEIYEIETKLTDFSEILTCGLEIQKQWSYLYGVLSESSSLKELLSVEAARFSDLTSDLNILFGAIQSAKTPSDVLYNSEYISALKSLLDALTRVRKSLNDFLEAQRGLFPRFYFIGNEDLLQLLGANTDFGFLSTQMRKMFGAVGRLEVVGTSIKGVYSIEGEMVALKNEVKVSPQIPVYQWMSSLDKELKHTLSALIIACYEKYSLKNVELMLNEFPFQVIWLCMLADWTKRSQKLETADMEELLQDLSFASDFLTNSKLTVVENHKQRMIDSLLSEMLGLKETTLLLSVAENKHSAWNEIQKFYIDSCDDPLGIVRIVQAGIEVKYGFEYIGVPETLVQTPILQTFFATMIHALSNNLGGSPFGPAGTGKTESVKYLGKRLGCFVLVFNCDDTFDYRSMARILFGISQIGAWGCFDEFNRLNTSLLSAVSSQVEAVQSSMMNQDRRISVLERNGTIHPNTALFITMNLGYAGRSQLPGNLKRMFREFSMSVPQTVIITKTLLKIMGIENSDDVSVRLVSFFAELELNTSSQSHYDFGLRALKSVIRNCNIQSSHAKIHASYELLLRSIRDIITPKLLDIDEDVFEATWTKTFAQEHKAVVDMEFKKFVTDFCGRQYLSYSDSFYKKCKQLYELQKSQQGLILVGGAGCGKTTVLNATLDSIQNLTNISNIVYTIDSKAIKKEQLYGTLDPITFEWQDGLFTSIIREINNDQLGEYNSSNIWIIFDSDLDPVYAETLNSVLDDNKVFTLPNGERLDIPSNLHIVFEVEELTFATPATISRCGMHWFDKTIVHPRKVFCSTYNRQLSSAPIYGPSANRLKECIIKASDAIFSAENFKQICEESAVLNHIMGFDIIRISKIYSKVMCSPYFSNFKDISKMSQSSLDLFVISHIALCIVWAFAGDCNVEEKNIFALSVQVHLQPYGLPTVNGSILDYEVSVVSGELLPLKRNIQSIELEAHQVLLPDLIIPTVDTYRHEAILFTLLREHQPLILCGPPGSGKTMTLQSALKRSDDHILIGMNFSKDTTVDSLLRTIEQHTTYKSTAEGLIMQPTSFGKQLVVFCDEINLPKPDHYKSQPVILFLRQLLEKNGFWSPKTNKWVSLKKIQIVAACNPPTDPGRSDMTKRFTRHTAVIMVDYPSKESLLHIYRTFFKAVLKASPIKNDYADNLARASVEIYLDCRKNFTVKQHPHYIFSPRELTRWVRGVYHAISNSESFDLHQLIKIWAYESRRIFSDRLVSLNERKSFDDLLSGAASSEFPLQNIVDITQSPLVFCDWLNMKYEESDLSKLRNFIFERLKTFCDEVLNKDIILHDQMIHAMLNVDRIMKQVQGHAILVAPSNSGKTTITRFVAWLNGVDVRIPMIHRNYSLREFDAFLRKVLMESGAENKKTCIILDESNMVEASFIERLNTLLANSEIPGLFQAEDYDSLIAKIRCCPYLPATVLDTEQGMYDWFTEQISKNLHVVINISDPKKSTSTNLITSPALFNRCVLTWMGTWKNDTLEQVARYYIDKIPLDQTLEPVEQEQTESPINIRSKVIQILRTAFQNYHSQLQVKYPSPALFMNSLKLLRRNFIKGLTEADNNQRFVRNGLTKLKETLLMVRKLNKDMESKREVLQKKKLEARKTLDQMLYDQNESERKQEASIEIQKILHVQENDISVRRDAVMKDLAKAEPAILEARRGVKNIKKQQLTELRTMINPPEAVKTTLEAVCILLGFQISSWKDIQQTIRKDDFIAKIVTFDTETMLSEEVKSYIQTRYLDQPNFKHKNVLRASQACGPLYLWVVAQISFSNALKKVGPLQKDLQTLEGEISRTRATSLAAEEMICELQEQIEKSKDLYSKIIRDIEILKSEMSSVETKVLKSTLLLESLNSEKERWTVEIGQFKDVKRNLLGNCLLFSLYSAYCFAHDLKARTELVKEWKHLLHLSNIDFDKSFTNLATNVSLEEKARWIESGLSEDDFAVETFAAVVCSPDEKYPLVIDPNGSILDTLYAVYESKLVITSFLDKNFSKSLENTLRFGGLLLIQDGEFFDPSVIKVLKQEFQNIGGRRSIELGDSTREFDVSNDFRMIIYTRDKSWSIPNSILTNTLLFNFTITKGNLESQTMQNTLMNVLPSLQTERKRLFEKNAACQLKLTTLGKKLLELLNTAESNILENEDLLNTLENLKLESATTSTEISKIQSLVLEQEMAITEFSPISKTTVQIFELLEWMRSKKHWFYDVEVNEFLAVFQCVFQYVDILANDRTGKPDKITFTIFRLMFCTFGPMFLENDRLSFAARLMELQIFSEESTKTIEEWDKVRSDINVLRKQQEVSERFVLFREGLMSGDAKDGLSQMVLSAMKQRPWKLSEFFSENIRSNVMLIGADKGVDGSYMIKEAAEQAAMKLITVAMGSSESCKIAEEALADCSGNGGWLLLQNIQMSYTWCNEVLPTYLKQINSNCNPNFKLFMTCSLEDNIHPSSQILQYSTKIAYEGESGILYKVKKFWGIIVDKKDTTGTCLYLKHLVCWIHSLLLERVKITGQNVEYHDLDFELAINSVEKCIEDETIDWPKLRFLVGKLIYSNRISHTDELYQWIADITFSILNEGCFRANSSIVGDVGSPSSKNSAHDITKWLNHLSWTIEQKDIWLSVPKADLEQLSFMDAVSCMSDLVAMNAVKN